MPAKKKTATRKRAARLTPRQRREQAEALQLAVDHGRQRAREVLRRRRRHRPLEEGPAMPPGGLLIAEGDSWFDYPFYSVLEELEDDFNYEIESVAHKGDTVEEMAYDDGQLAKLSAKLDKLGQQQKVPRAILLSGGGNDVAGDEFSVFLNHKKSGLQPLNDSVVDGVLKGRLQFAIVSLVTAVTALAKKAFGKVIPVLMHGYDFPVADGRGYLGGFWVLPGPWLEPGFRRKGYALLPERVVIMEELINRFSEVVKALPALPGLEHVTFVDLRGKLSNKLAGNEYKKSWENELHPTEGGFKVVAAEFHAAIKKLPMP
jgi:lysophospholipase L1-like esterase